MLLFMNSKIAIINAQNARTRLRNTFQGLISQRFLTIKKARRDDPGQGSSATTRIIWSVIYTVYTLARLLHFNNILRLRTTFVPGPDSITGARSRRDTILIRTISLRLPLPRRPPTPFTKKKIIP